MLYSIPLKSLFSICKDATRGDGGSKKNGVLALLEKLTSER